MLTTYLSAAIAENASDIFLTTAHVPAFKLLGKIEYQTQFSVLTEADIDGFLLEIIGEAGKEAFGREKDLDFAISLEGIGRFRVNASRTQQGKTLVLRPIKSAIPELSTLSLPMEEFIRFTKYANGIILFTGTMGSGKSTSMASLIEYMNIHTKKHILTIEDPVEYLFESKQSLVDQREVPLHSHNFFRALRGSFREAVDVLLLGEMRDLETMSLAMTAAETGALVFSTLHTAGSIHAVDRIIDAFPADRQQQIRVQLSQVLRAVVWQTLLPNKEGTGMVPAVEILFNNHAVAHLIRKGQTYQIRSILETSKNEGMIPMEKSVAALVQSDMVDKAMADAYIFSVKKSNLSLGSED